MKKPIKLLLAAAVLGAALYILLSPTTLGKVSCEVCMEFKGKEDCRTARAPSRDDAIVTARDNACAQIAFGREDSILCGNTEPASIRCSE
jgi:recombinational DNA repair protein RecR